MRILVLLALLISLSTVSYAKDFCKRFPTDTAIECYTPTNPPPSGGTPSLPFNSVQYNNAGSFGGSSSFIFDGTNVGIGTSTTIAPLTVNGTVASTGINVQASRFIQFFGDSMQGQSIYTQYPMPADWNVQSWTANTAYLNGEVVKDGSFYYRATTAGTSTSSGSGPSTSISAGTLAGGSGYTGTGSYPGVTLTGGTCTTSPKATIVVAGGAVTSVTRTNDGLGCAISDVLTTANTNIGGAGSGFTYTVTQLGQDTSSTALIDNTVVWTFIVHITAKNGITLGTKVEAWSNGQLTWDMSQGNGGIFGGVRRIYVITPGANYTNTDTVTWFSGAGKCTLTVDSGGGITGCTIKSTGYSTNGITSSGLTITTSTGSGAVLSASMGGVGTFGSLGNQLIDMNAALTTVNSSLAQYIVFMGGTNDLTAGTSFATMISYYKLILSSLVNNGKKVCVVGIPPRNTGLTTAISLKRQYVNRWLRDYVTKYAYTNSTGSLSMVYVDPDRYWTDATAVTGDVPIGGNGGSGAVTQDGLHPSQIGAAALGYQVWEAMKGFLINTNVSSPRSYSAIDAYDPTNNPGGNMLEGIPWIASTAYVVGQIVTNDTAPVKTYACITAGTSAGSGGPTGTSTNITDGSAHWIYAGPAYMSVLQGSSGTCTTASGMVASGNLPAGLTLTRTSGSASGTVICGEESPWSDGTKGQRGIISFSAGSGTATENWRLVFRNSTYNLEGITSADLGVAYVYADMEIEVTGIRNFSSIYADLTDGSISIHNYGGDTASGTSSHVPDSYGTNIEFPRRYHLITQPFLLPTNLVNLSLFLQLSLDASGAANSATGTIKVDYVAIKRAYQ